MAPKKIERCIKKVMSSGKSKSSAYGICSDSTGIKRKAGGGWTQGKNHLQKREGK